MLLEAGIVFVPSFTPGLEVQVTDGSPVEWCEDYTGAFGDVAGSIAVGGTHTFDRPIMLRSEGGSEIDVVYPLPEQPEPPDQQPPGFADDGTPLLSPSDSVEEGEAPG